MRRQVAAVVLMIAAAAEPRMARAQRRSGLPTMTTPQVSVSADRLDRLERWLTAVDHHEPGDDDDAVIEIAGWSNDELRGLWVDVTVLAHLMRNVKATQFTVQAAGQANATTVRYPTPLLQRMKVFACAAAGLLSEPDCVSMHATDALDQDLTTLAQHVVADRNRTGDANYVPRRAALLHADVAMLQPHARVEPFSGPSPNTRWLGPQTWRVDISDGRSLDVGLSAVHWDIARLALDQVRPRGADRPAPERDAMVRAWYRATSAWMQFHEDHDTQHLDRGRGIFPDDPDLQFLSGCQRESYASPAIQAAARSVVLPPGLTIGVESERSELRQAEAFFRRALALRPGMGEAHLRLGRVLALVGRHAEAAAELHQALTLVEDKDLRYYGELFAGAEEAALGRFDAAHAAYDRASTLFPLAQSPYLAISELAHRRGDRAGAAAAVQRVFALPAALDGARDDPWWRYHVVQARNAEELLDALGKPFRRAVEQ
jgi:tetratricopeptide (TPR) repeat protein